MNPEGCTVCRHIVAHDWTGLDKSTHCRECCAIWGGHSTIHCVSCHRTFSSEGNLRRHQTTWRDANDDLRVECHDPVGVRTGPDRLPFFGEPQPNGYGTLIWRQVAPTDGAPGRVSLTAAVSTGP